MRISTFVDSIDPLFEGRVDYWAMLKPVLNKFSEEPVEVLSPNVKGAQNKTFREVKTEYARKEIEWARWTLKKSDRVIWYLRYVKAILLNQIQEGLGNTFMWKHDPNWSPHFADGIPFVPSTRAKHELEHYLSLDCSEIQEMVFGKRTAADIFNSLEAAEKKWATERKGKIPEHMNPKAVTIIDFGNGWVWQDLKQAACSEEGKAMGHCGNSPRYHTDDTILSLRKKIVKGSVVFYEPHLTFTMDDYRSLQERKGRGNAKPEARYHSMIVALLLLKQENDDDDFRTKSGAHYYYVDSLGEGHWQPENDFQIDDLSEELRERVVSERPDFGNFFDCIRGGLSRDYILNEKFNEYLIEEELFTREMRQRFNVESSGQITMGFLLDHGLRDAILTGGDDSIHALVPLERYFGPWATSAETEALIANAPMEEVEAFRKRVRAKMSLLAKQHVAKAFAMVSDIAKVSLNNVHGDLLQVKMLFNPAFLAHLENGNGDPALRNLYQAWKDLATGTFEIDNMELCNSFDEELSQILRQEKI